MGIIDIWPKQYGPYHFYRRVATEGKLNIQGRRLYHQQYQAGRAGSQLAGARMPHIQHIKYPRSPIL